MIFKWSLVTFSEDSKEVSCLSYSLLYFLNLTPVLRAVSWFSVYVKGPLCERIGMRPSFFSVVPACGWFLCWNHVEVCDFMPEMLKSLLFFCKSKSSLSRPSPSLWFCRRCIWRVFCFERRATAQQLPMHSSCCCFELQHTSSSSVLQEFCTANNRTICLVHISLNFFNYFFPFLGLMF